MAMLYRRKCHDEINCFTRHLLYYWFSKMGLSISMVNWLFLLVITVVNDFGRALVVYKFNRVILVFENVFLNSFEILVLRSRFSFVKKYYEIFKWFYWFYTYYIGRGEGFFIYLVIFLFYNLKKFLS